MDYYHLTREKFHYELCRLLVLMDFYGKTNVDVCIFQGTTLFFSKFYFIIRCENTIQILNYFMLQEYKISRIF